MDVFLSFKNQVSGWGQTSERGLTSPVLKSAVVPLVSQTLCKEQYQRVNAITPRMLCAGKVGIGGIDTCRGDSGGKRKSAKIQVLIIIGR